MSSSAKKRSPQEGLTTGSGFSGSFGDFGAYYGVVGGTGGRTGGGKGALPPAVTPVPQVVVTAPKPSPTISSPPPDDIIDPGSGDPSDWPPFEDPNDPFIPPRDPGSAEPPEDSDDLPEIVVAAPREPAPAAPPLSEAMFPFAGAPAPKPRPVRRAPRRKPAPKRRPVRRPRPTPGPRIVEPVPEIQVVARRVLPILGILSLVPLYMRVLQRIDRYGTEHMIHRLFPVPYDRRDDDKDRSRSPDTDAPGDRAPVGAPDEGELPTLIVEGTRPPAFSSPPSLQLPSFREPGYIYPPSVPNPFRPPATRVKPDRSPRFEVMPDAPTSVQPFPLPLAPPPRPRPSPAPLRPPRPNPSTGAPDTSLVPGPGAGPGPVGRIDPVPDLGPVPLEDLDRCNCPKKSKPKKRKERTLCSRGTYVQTAKGLQKQPTKYFDCASGAERPPPSKPKAYKPSPMKKPKGGWPTNLKDLLNPKP